MLDLPRHSDWRAICCRSWRPAAGFGRVTWTCSKTTNGAGFGLEADECRDSCGESVERMRREGAARPRMWLPKPIWPGARRIYAAEYINLILLVLRCINLLLRVLRYGMGPSWRDASVFGSDIVENCWRQPAAQRPSKHWPNRHYTWRSQKSHLHCRLLLLGPPSSFSGLAQEPGLPLWSASRHHCHPVLLDIRGAALISWPAMLASSVPYLIALRSRAVAVLGNQCTDSPVRTVGH